MSSVNYRCWCDKDGCGWEREGEAPSREMAGYAAFFQTTGHHVATRMSGEQHETSQSVDTETDWGDVD